MYRDVNKGGEIFDYYYVPDELEPVIQRELDNAVGTQGIYDLFANNCRHFTDMALTLLVKKYNLKPIKAPDRLSTRSGDGALAAPIVWTHSPGPTSK